MTFLRKWRTSLNYATIVLCLGTAQSAGADVFYDVEQISKTGDIIDGGAAAISGFSEPSINSSGVTAFVCSNASGGTLCIRDPAKHPIPLRLGFPETLSRQYAFGPQINDAGQVVARDLANNFSFIRIWDEAGPIVQASGRFATGVTDPNYSLSDFDSVFSHPSVNNSGQVVFSALEAHAAFKFNGAVNCRFVSGFGDTCLATTTNSILPPFYNVYRTAIPVRPMIGGDGSVVFEDIAQEEIVLWENDFSQTKYSTSGFDQVGRMPGISDSGKAIAFAGSRGNGVGIFASVDVGSGWKLIRIAGEESSPDHVNELGTGIDGTGFYFDFDAPNNFIDTRVGVAHVEQGEPGFKDDTIFVTFLATPNAASPVRMKGWFEVQNAGEDVLPVKPGLVYTQRQGLWVVRVDLGEDEFGEPIARVHTPLPVVQVGDTVHTVSGSFRIDALRIYDPISIDTTANAEPLSHWVSFAATSGTTSLIYRARPALQKPVVFDPGHGAYCRTAGPVRCAAPPDPLNQGTQASYQRPGIDVSALAGAEDRSIVEDNLTLDIGIAAHLEALTLGLNSMITRTDDYVLLPFACGSNALQMCKPDRMERAEFARRREADVFVSIHTNALNSTSHGVEAFRCDTATDATDDRRKGLTLLVNDAVTNGPPESVPPVSAPVADRLAQGHRPNGGKLTCWDVINPQEYDGTLVEVAFHDNTVAGPGQPSPFQLNAVLLSRAGWRTEAGLAIARATYQYLFPTRTIKLGL